MAQVNLKCSGDSGSFHIPAKPDTVTFKCPASCVPLLNVTFTPPVKSFTLIGPKNGDILYSYDGTPISGGCPFSYQTSQKTLGGNGTGVIKN